MKENIANSYLSDSKFKYYSAQNKSKIKTYAAFCGDCKKELRPKGWESV